MMAMNHVMIDLETMGTRFDAPILAVGAVFFDPDAGKLGKTFYEKVSIADAFKYGKPSGDTVRWWLTQAPEAQKEVIAGTKTLAVVLNEFVEWLGGVDPQVWGNVSTFDISILEYGFGRIGETAPWAFWNVRDCRTIAEIAKPFMLPKDVARPSGSVAHTALDDAIYQATWVSEMWRRLRGKPAAVPVAVDDDLV